MDWNDPEWVRFFGDRDPDWHLQQILGPGEASESWRVLDLGCAAGRNTEAILEAGWATYALDLTPAMLKATRKRVQSLWPPGRGEGRILQGDMRSLPYRDGTFHLIVALGVFHEAHHDDDLIQSLSETHRVLEAEGQVLVSVFSVEMLPPGAQPLPLQKYLFSTPDGRNQCRLSPADLEKLFSEVGLTLVQPVEKRFGKEGDRPRVTLLGLFAKR